jgi:hypothetical protein
MTFAIGPEAESDAVDPEDADDADIAVRSEAMSTKGI